MKVVLAKESNVAMTIAFCIALAPALLLLALVGTTREAEATFSGENGKIAFASNRGTDDNPEGDFEIFTMNPDGTGVTQLTHNTAFDFDPEWSADGQKIAFESNRDRFSEIFVMNADGSEVTQVTTNPDFSFDRSPTFSPDGQKVAFESNRATGEGVNNPEKDIEIFVVNLDSTGLTQLTKNAGRELHPDWSPNGRTIAFVSERDFQPGIYTMKADGTKQKKHTRNPATVFQFPGWSPDGEWITFMSNLDGPDEVHVMRANGTGHKRLTHNGGAQDDAPVFSPDGRWIAFNSDRDGNFEIYAMNARDGKKPTNLTDHPASDLTPDWQPLQ